MAIEVEQERLYREYNNYSLLSKINWVHDNLYYKIRHSHSSTREDVVHQYI